MKIDKEFWLKWAAALRSGKYKQGRGALCDQGMYCCLGVACEIWDVEKHSTDGTFFEYGESLCAGYAPSELGIFGINSQGELSNGSNLTEVNDAGATFAEIADIIEREANNAHE